MTEREMRFWISAVVAAAAAVVLLLVPGILPHCGTIVFRLALAQENAALLFAVVAGVAIIRALAQLGNRERRSPAPSPISIEHSGGPGRKPAWLVEAERIGAERVSGRRG